MDTLGEALPREIERCQELLAEYQQIPNGGGAFAAHTLTLEIRQAYKALAEQDVAAMIRAYNQLVVM